MKILQQFKGAYDGQDILYTTDVIQFIEPDCALILAFFQGKLLMTRHKIRGWELPGGKREGNEFIISTALRELYEETGAESEQIEPIAQYKILNSQEVHCVKTIFISKVKEMHPIPPDFETSEVKLFEIPPTVIEIENSSEYSPLLRDKVYQLAISLAAQHRYYFLSKVCLK